MINSRSSLLLCCALCLLCPCAARAQDFLLDSNVKIARHDKRTTRIKFQRSDKTDPLDRWGLMFEQSIESGKVPEEANLVHYEALPRCEKSEVRLLDVKQTTPGTDSTDVLYYAQEDAEQAKRASAYAGFKVPYQAALMRDPSTQHPEYWQSFARFIQIDCLPVRFHFTYVGNSRYIEYRLGDAAWEKPGAK